MPTLYTTMRGGLNVAVSFNVYPPEPDCGIFSFQIEIDGLSVKRRNGKWRAAPWLEKLITQEGWSILVEKCRNYKEGDPQGEVFDDTIPLLSAPF